MSLLLHLHSDVRQVVAPQLGRVFGHYANLHPRCYLSRYIPIKLKTCGVPKYTLIEPPVNSPRLLWQHNHDFRSIGHRMAPGSGRFANRQTRAAATLQFAVCGRRGTVGEPPVTAPTQRADCRFRRSPEVDLAETVNHTGPRGMTLVRRRMAIAS